MSNMPPIPPVPPAKPGTAKQAHATPPPAPSKPVPSADHIHGDLSRLALQKLPVEREPPAATAAPQATAAIPAREPKRCLYTNPVTGLRCRRDGRWKSGLCPMHDPARADEIKAMRQRAGEAMRHNSGVRARGMSSGNVARFMDALRQVNGKKESAAGALDWIAEKLLRREITPKEAGVLRVLVSRRNHLLATYSRPCHRRTAKRADVPPGVGMPHTLSLAKDAFDPLPSPPGEPAPAVPPSDTPQASDAPTGILAPAEGQSFDPPDAPPFDLGPLPKIDIPHLPPIVL